MTENEISSDENERKGLGISKIRLAWVVVVAVVIGVQVVSAILESTFDRLKQKGWTQYSIKYSNSSGNVKLAVDDEGDIWIGQGNTLKELSPDGARQKRMLTIPTADGNSVSIYTIEFDREGRIWAGTSDGLYMLSPGAGWTQYTASNSNLIDDSIQALAIDSQNQVWIGTAGGVSMYLPGGEWTNYTTENSDIPHDSVGLLAVDHQDHIWAITSGGLGVIAPDGNLPNFVTLPRESAVNGARALAIDRDDRVLIGTNAGLYTIAPDGQWTIYPSEKDAASWTIRAITIDEQDRIWVIDNYRDLSSFSPDHGWTTYRGRFNPLTSYSGVKLAVAVDGRILITTANKVFFFDESESADEGLLNAISSGLEILNFLSCLSQISIALLLVVSLVRWRRGRREAQVSEPKINDPLDSQTAFREGQLLVVQGKREQAVKIFLKIFQEEPDELRQQVIDELDLLGEVEKF